MLRSGNSVWLARVANPLRIPSNVSVPVTARYADPAYVCVAVCSHDGPSPVYPERAGGNDSQGASSRTTAS